MRYGSQEGKARRVVIQTGRVGKGGRPKLWAFGLEDYAELFGISVVGVRRMIQRGKVDPGDLGSVCEEYMRRAMKSGRHRRNDANSQ